jgi:outer membrane protein
MLIMATVLAVAPASAQEGESRPVGRALELDEALRLATAGSEEIAIASAGVIRAEGDLQRAAAAKLPQLDGSASYSRTLASQFQDLGGGGGPPPPPQCEGAFAPNPSAPVEERIAALETELGCPAGFGGIDFDQIGFGSENTWNVGLSLFYPLFTGGRLTGQTRIAESGREAAEIGLSSAEAQLRLQATEAYFDAQLSDRLLAIAEATYAQLQEALRLTELRVSAGGQAEFDGLRARVAMMNQQPVVIQRRAQRDLAYERLRLMLDLPADEPLDLVTPLEEVESRPMQIDTTVMTRAAVRQALEGVELQEGQVTIARAQRLPSVNLTSQYGQVYYGGVVPRLNEFRDNWSVGAALQIPIFSGGRISADVQSARAGVLEAEARLEQMVGLAILDARNTVAQLNAAAAIHEASEFTVSQARQAYEIAELRFAEGISTQLELTDARILLEQALANRATAARDLHVARTRAELLPYLPIATGGGAAGMAGGSSGPPAMTGGFGAGFPAGSSGAGGTSPGGGMGGGGGAGGGAPGSPAAPGMGGSGF